MKGSIFTKKELEYIRDSGISIAEATMRGYDPWEVGEVSESISRKAEKFLGEPLRPYSDSIIVLGDDEEDKE